MKIAKVEALHCDGGWRPWTFVRIETDGGLVGWGECSDNRSPYGIAGCVRDLRRPADRPGPAPGRAPLLGHAARARARTAAASRTRPWPASSWRCGTSRPRRSACRSTSCSAGRCATACGSTGRTAGPRGRAWARCSGTPPLQDLRRHRRAGARGRGARLHRAQDQHGHPRRSGHRLLPRLRQRHQHHRRRAHGGDPRRHRPAHRDLPRRGGPEGRALPRPELQLPHRGRAAHRQAAGEVRHAVAGVRQLGPDALLQIKQSTSTRLASCESLVALRQYRPFLEKHAVDVAIIDVPWNGFSQSVQIGRLAEACEINIAPAQLLQPPGRPALAAPLRRAAQRAHHGDRHRRRARGRARSSRGRPEIRDGHIWLSDAPGWGADIDERVLREHPWPRPGDTGGRLFYGMDPAQMTARPR